MKKTAILITGILLLLLAGCAEKKVILDHTKAGVQERAAQAWRNENYPLSQQLYTRLLNEFELRQDQQLMAWQRLAVSSHRNQDYQTALQALDQWADLNPRALDQWKWHYIYAQALRKTRDEQEYLHYLEELYRNHDKPLDLRCEAALNLIQHYFQGREYHQAMAVLEYLYSVAETDDEKLKLENISLEFFENLGLQELEQVRLDMDREKQLLFPYNVFWWTFYLEKLKDDHSRWGELRPELFEIAEQSELVHRDPWLGTMKQWKAELGRPASEITLLLPLSGQYSSVGWKILRGAGLAHFDMQMNGMDVRIKTINTDEPKWLERLGRMDTLSLVGGPLSRQNWEKIKEEELNSELVFLTFLPSLEQEGVQGWRFFPSPGDQVRALLEKTIHAMGITDFAVMYPEDDFGRTFSETFMSEAQKQGARIRGMQSYPPDDPARWNQIVSSFLKTKSQQDPLVGSSPSFQAVFIPDTLSRAQGLIPQFFYFDQDHLVFLGPMIWYQAYKPDTLEQQFFSLALASGAWNSESSNPRAMSLRQSLDRTAQEKTDFWVALGYDFVRFAARIGELPSPENPDEVNRILANNNFRDWSMAPVSWDEQGRAFQELFVFQMDREKLTPADAEQLIHIVDFRKQRRAIWLERLREKKMQEQ